MKQSSLPWRAVYFIQRLISWIAPPLHSLHWKIFALLLFGLFLPAVYFFWQVRVSIERNGLRSLQDIALPALLAFGVAAATSYLLSNYLTRVITGMARRARRIADGETGVRLETWTKSELGDLARALEAMRLKLEGRAYIEEMASTLSHELKTPLASIRGAAEIAEDSSSPEIRKKFLANIRAETDRLTGIVNNLLALSRIETQPADAGDSCRLDEVARETAAIFQSRAETLGLHFHSNIAATAEPLPLSADQLRRILEILLDNAFAFTPAGKNVSLQTSARSATVRDEGSGMAPEVRARVFERFFTTVNPLTGRRGSGLGLAIAQSIVTRARGTITLQSTPGLGTQVTVAFPDTGQ